MKYFVNIYLQPPKQTTPVKSKYFSTDKEVNDKRWAHDFPQFEQWYVTEMNPATGGYTVENKDGTTSMKGVLNISLRPLRYNPGDVVLIGFYDCNRQYPYIWGSGFTAGIQNLIVDFFLSWIRYRAKETLSFSVPGWDNPAEENSSIVFEPSDLTGEASILRTDAEGVLFSANGSTLYTLDLSAESPEPVGTELASEIVSLHLGAITGRSYCTIQAFSDGGDEDYERGYSDGEEVAEESSATSQGAEDCFNTEGYRAEEFAELLLAAFPADEEESEEYIDGYEAGLLATYIELYNIGYEGEGCMIP